MNLSHVMIKYTYLNVREKTNALLYNVKINPVKLCNLSFSQGNPAETYGPCDRYRGKIKIIIDCSRNQISQMQVLDAKGTTVRDDNEVSFWIIF